MYWGQSALPHSVPTRPGGAGEGTWRNRWGNSAFAGAAKLSEEIGLPGELWQILAALGELQLEQDDDSEAHRAFAWAAEIAQTLAHQIEDTQQRAVFLSAQPTRYVSALQYLHMPVVVTFVFDFVAIAHPHLKSF